MNVENSNRYVMMHRYSGLFLALALLLFLAGDTCAKESGDPQRYQENGKLTEVEKNNSSVKVIINERAYSVDSSALYVNAAGRPVSLDKLTVPSEVHFEFSYMESKPKRMEPVIVYIGEIKKNSNNKRSME